MIVEHCFTLVARCPVDDAHDVYAVTVTTDRIVPVEDILAEAKRLAAEPRYQEEITTALAYAFGVAVETVGPHMSGGVKTTCRVDPVRPGTTGGERHG